MRQRRRSRGGFTLLEVIMALTIAVLLLGALYFAVDLQIRSAQISRDTIQGGTLERTIIARMDADAAQVIGLSDPARYRFQAGLDTVSAGNTPAAAGSTAGAATSPTSSASSATTSATGSTASGSGTTSSSSFGSSSSTTDSSGVSNVVLPLGVMGDNQTLHLFVSNLPREIYSSGQSLNNLDAGALPPSSDIRRISYWLVGGEDSPGGLARQEVALATSDDALQNLPPGIDKETSFIIADEVRSLNFQYWDGTEWQDSWDSTTLGPDGVTPIGSPLAIAVTISVAPQHASGPPQENEPLRTIRHVLVIPSANGATLQAAAASGTSTQTNSSMTNGASTTNGSGVSP